MVALPLLDVVLASGEVSGRPARIASQLVHSALSDLEQFEQLEDSLSPDEPTTLDRQTAALLRGLFERWAQEAESLLGLAEDWHPFRLQPDS